MELEDFRKEINKIDNKLIELLNERGKITQKIGTLKKGLNIEIHQPKREKQIIEQIKTLA